MNPVDKAINLISGAKNLLILTGAGISAESGIPTFRGKEGYWKNYSPEELATPQAFARDPGFVWEWYNYRRKLILEKQPNPAHFACAELQERFNTHIITQNVDGFHKKVYPDRVLEMHGNIFTSRCTGCHFEITEFRSDENLPRCSRCESLLRPGVVWFGESLDPVIMNTIKQLISTCDVFLVIGTSGVVYPAAGFAHEVARNKGAVIEINIQPAAPRANILPVQGRAADVLPLITKALST